MTKAEIMEYSKEELLNPENLLRIFAEAPSELDRVDLQNAYQDRAKECKCYRQVQALFKAAKADIKENLKEQKVTANNVTDFGHITGELNCGNWIADNNGVRVLTIFGEKVCCYHPILPIERLFNIETKTEKITLAYKKGHNWKEITVDKGLIASSTKIVRLADYGVAVTSETAKDLVKYLSDVENLNEIAEKNSTSKLGWHNDYKDFIPYDTAVVFDDESKFRELIGAIRESGSEDIWLELCRKIRANKSHYEPQVYLAASFASVLISKLNMLPFIVNLWGSTGKGKTVALMLAASVWANPAENRYITDSYATQNAFEIRLDCLNHLPLCLDDMSKVRDKTGDGFTDLIYLMCSGKGKDRSNVDLGLNKVKTWSNTILSNMERPLANETMKGGAINRILDFEMCEGYIFENGNAVVEILKDNYGFAGVKFVDLIKELPVEVINNIRRDFEQKIKEEAKKQNSVKEEKQILPLSVLLTADKIATDYIFEDGIYLDIPTMVSQLKDVNEVSEGQRAYDTLKDFVIANKNMFPNEMPQNGSAWGCVKDEYIYILPTIFRKLAAEQNFSTKAFLSWAIQKKLLKKNDRNLQKVWIGKDQIRFYCVKNNQEADEQGDSDFQDADGQELPFD
jgi:uncharacterized protein (DUF927 family)